MFKGFNDEVCVPPSDRTYTDDVRGPRHGGSEQKIQNLKTRRIHYHHICSIYCLYSLEIIVRATFIDFEMYCVRRSSVSLGPRFFYPERIRQMALRETNTIISFGIDSIYSLNRAGVPKNSMRYWDCAINS